MDSSLLPFFQPQGIVIVGASTSPEKLGYGVARNLTQSGYNGAIHFVGQKSGELFGRKIYTSLREIPDPVDLAILIVPPQSTPQVIQECGERGIKAAIVVASGFREAGREGAALEEQCVQIARQHGIRLLGPNCIGTIDTHLPLDTTFLQPPMPAQGQIGFISHSGAFCAAIIDWSRTQGFGFSRIVSLGNHADVNETDMLTILAEDEHTKVIVLYLESISDGQRFVKVAREITQHKPIIALKVGRFESGQKAAASHTGALAASDIAFDAAFEKAGILRADTTEQMFDWARALETYPRGFDHLRSTTSKNRIAILTNAGGPGVIAADALEHHGLTLAQLTDTTLKNLSASLPPSANVQNPVDMLASASPSQYAECLKVLLADENVEAVMVILPPPPMFKVEDVAKKIVETLESDSWPSASDEPLDSKIRKPVVISLMGSTLIQEAAKTFQLSNIPTYPFPERAASAVAALAKRAEYLIQGEPEYDRPRFADLPPMEDRPFLEDLLARYMIQYAPARLAHSPEEAADFMQELGYLAVMKIASPDILHKSDVGGVMLNITSRGEAHRGYTTLIERVKAARPDARIDGVHMQHQIPNGQEVIVGMVRDPQFGPLMMFGSGGVEVEGLNDVAFALAPLNQAEAEKMIRKTWAGKKLKGFRHIPAADEEAVIDVLINLSYLVLEHQEIAEVELNPLRVLSKGVVAVDVRVAYQETQQ